MLKVHSLTDLFDANNANLNEALHDKNRGYGIVAVNVNGLTFGIPLRTNLSHSYGAKLDKVTRQGKILDRGLDYTKAVLIRDPAEIGAVFNVPPAQKKALIDRKKSIENQFSKYVNNYVKAVQTEKTNTINSNAYKWSTLKNYHAELGLQGF